LACDFDGSLIHETYPLCASGRHEKNPPRKRPSIHPKFLLQGAPQIEWKKIDLLASHLWKSREANVDDSIRTSEIAASIDATIGEHTTSTNDFACPGDSSLYRLDVNYTCV
jgi:hypothetical protein